MKTPAARPPRRFVRATIEDVVIPGFGSVGNQILIGEQFAAYVPHLLREIQSEATSRPGPLTEVLPTPIEEAEKAEPEVLVEKRRPGRPRKHPLPTPPDGGGPAAA